MKSTIFGRILLGTLLPVMVVFTIVIATINSIMAANDRKNVEVAISQAVEQVSDYILQKLDAQKALQNNISRGIASIRFDQPEAKAHADALLRTLLSSSGDIYSAWFCFAHDVFIEDQHYYRSEYRDPSNESPDRSMQLMDRYTAAGTAPEWYATPMATGEIYVNAIGRHNDLDSLDSKSALVMSTPIIYNGRTIGVIGVDILYEDLVNFDQALTAVSSKIMLISSDGTILFSVDKDDIGGNIFDFQYSSSVRESIATALSSRNGWVEEIDSPFFQESAIATIYPFKLDNTSDPIFLYRSIPRSAATGMVVGSIEVVFVTSIIGMILLAFCVFFTTRSIVRHIQRITDNFHIVADVGADLTLAGNDFPVLITNVAELDILQAALTSMMHHLWVSHDLKLKVVEASVEAEKLRAAAEAKDSFFASMSHEIRTPMNAVIGISDIMLHEEPLTPLQEKHIWDIKTASDSLLAIINDVLDISKMESGSMMLHCVDYNFPSLIDNIASLAGHLAEKSKLEFILKIEGTIPKCLKGDDLRVRQILLNLLGNAVKYTKRGFVSLKVAVRDDTLTFEVADSGIGIKKADYKTIFEPFKQVDTRRNRDVKGTGLGLPILKRLVGLMNGTVSVTSEYGVGSVFNITMPLVLGDESLLRSENIDKRVRYADNLRILVVDDNQINLNVTSGLLSVLYGIRCETANSGLEAISKVRERDYDLVFMDHMMPELDGVDTMRRIRTLGEKYKALPIIALTANAVIGVRENLLSTGMDDFLSKPIRRDELEKVMYRWIPEDKRIFEASAISVAQASDVSKLPDAALFKPAYALQTEENEPKHTPEFTLPPSSRQTPPPHRTPENERKLPISTPKLPADEILAKLEQCEALNLHMGMENIGYAKDMYIQSLKLLLQKIDSTNDLLAELLAAGSMKELQVHIHGAKGALASVGASNLAEHAKQIEIAAGNADIDFCREEIPSFAADMARFAGSLKAALEPDKPETDKNESPAEAFYFEEVNDEPAYEETEADIERSPIDDIRVLCIALESYDYENIMDALLEACEANWSNEEHDVLIKAKALIDVFQYPDARTLLEDKFL